MGPSGNDGASLPDASRLSQKRWILARPIRVRTLQVMEISSMWVIAGHPLRVPENIQRPSAVCTREEKKASDRTGRDGLVVGGAVCGVRVCR